MERIVYLDAYIVYNFFMDFSILFISASLLKQPIKILRMILASIMACVYAAIFLILHFNGTLFGGATYFIVPAVMCSIAFGKQGKSKWIKNAVVLLVVSVLVYGTLEMIFNMLEELAISLQIVDFSNVKLRIVATLFSVLLLGCFLNRWVSTIKHNISFKNNLRKVLISVNGKEICLQGLVDTGNSLKEPYTGKWVSVLEKEKVKGIESGLNKIYIPFNSVGTNHGLMEGFVAEYMVVEDRKVDKPFIGLYSGILSKEKDYSILLNPNIIEGE